MRVTFWEPAPPYEVPGKGEFPTQFAPHALDHLIGTQAPLTLHGRVIGTVTVVDIVVDDDGRGATWTMDTEEDQPLTEEQHDARMRAQGYEKGPDGWRAIAAAPTGIEEG
jgi:hypothetical protein